MKIGIVGKGNVGSTLGKVWAARGHEVMFGVRDPESAEVQALLTASGPQARAGSVDEAAAFGEVILLAVPWGAAQTVVRSAGDLRGKILVDATNPLAPGLAGLEVGLDTSAGELVAGWAPGARVVKAFNSTGAGNMADPNYGDHAATMFLAADDAEAKAVVTRLGEDAGFEMIDAGPLANARLLEPLAMLWISLAYRRGFGPNFAFKVLKR